MFMREFLTKLARLNVTSSSSIKQLAQPSLVPSIQLKSSLSYLNVQSNNSTTSKNAVTTTIRREFSLQAPQCNLMEFFDSKTNWSEPNKVKHGRPWRLDDLRLKSNTDLHKLWYVLHKERNMLLTMEEIYIKAKRPMPSHERIAKVNLYMI